MSKNFYLLSFSAFLFSCSNYLPYSSATQTKSITDIPLKQSGNDVDCFLNDQTPSKPFYKVKITEVTGSANASYDELIISLKNKAKEEGLDAVMILSKQQEMAYENLNEKYYVRDSSSAAYYRQLAQPYQKLTAVGIKYLENINYLDTIVKATTFQFADNNKATINFDFYGNPIFIENTKLNDFYRDSMEPFDIDRHAHLAVKNWQYKMGLIFTDQVEEFKKEGDIVLVDAKITTDDANKYDYKIYNPATTRINKFTLKIERDDLGKIIKKTLSQKNKVIWVEEMAYQKNAMKSFKRYRMNNNQQEIIFAATNQFYGNQDLPKAL